ncbi:ferritin-like domain-containing protein [Caulobacter sp. UNC358MFTsu5.1]|uniref:ferritin-like domain-containing protein n=1 Tax=Caulobacter sp. UNC358MFTsu5.1 TaxID=1449049 RepID=UPI0004A76B0E|nr:ferritin-like domain-containing protein [Caulobacter sp. UNC358MFTsu5.1]
MQSPLSSVHRWVWRDARRRANNLLRFAEVEADGGRDLVRAAEQTKDPLLRRLFLVHALDEQRHAGLFRQRGLALLSGLPRGSDGPANTDWLAPGERGLDDLRVEQEADGALLAFLHLSEKAAARDFTHYIAVLDGDPPTREVFEKVCHDEAFHMNYTHAQLLRVAPKDHGRLLWMARLRRLWSLYLRFAGALASVIGTVVLTLQYFVLLPPFALMARRAQRREPEGWSPIAAERNGAALKRQY